MIWWIAIIGTVLISFKATVIMCAINFEVVQNVDDTNSLVSKTTIIKNGKNVSFSCKIVGLETTNNNNFDDNQVVWGKKAKGLRFNNVFYSSNLSFTPITLKDRGVYFCATLKHSLYETIYIAVVKSLDNKFNKSENRWKRENENLQLPISNFSTNKEDHLRVTMSPDLLRSMKKKVFNYETKHFGHQSYSERLREYARVIAPLVAVTLIISTLLYYMMKKFYLCATYRARNLKTEVGCQHSTCGHHCILPKKNYGKDDFNKNNTNTNQEVDSKNDDAVIFLPFLFDIT